MINYCKDFLRGKCKYDEKCKFTHEENICFHFMYKTCKYGDKCTKTHIKNKRKKNTECFVPLDEEKSPIDLRIVTNNIHATELFNKKITKRDLILIDNLFPEFDKWYIHDNILEELELFRLNNPEKQLYKKWHGSEALKIDGCHYIADDKLDWKKNCETFNFVVDRLSKYFNMRVEASRLNWYKDSSEWKPFHHDSAYINPDKAKVQNFTVAVSFGSNREAALEHSITYTRVKLPITSGSVYCFSNDTNSIWRHGILQNKEECERNGSRISIILWGWVEMM